MYINQELHPVTAKYLKAKREAKQLEQKLIDSIHVDDATYEKLEKVWEDALDTYFDACDELTKVAMEKAISEGLSKKDAKELRSWRHVPEDLAEKVFTTCIKLLQS